MGERTKIEWTDHTFNPWIGCTKVSPACDNCYAEAMMDSRLRQVKWGRERRRTSPQNWRQPYKWNNAAEIGKPVFVFCASLADVFDNQVPREWRRDLFDMILATPNLTWLLLTKRIGNVRNLVADLEIDRFPRNVAIGATMANQHEYDRDAPKLRALDMRLHPVFTFGSFEPLLGPVRLNDSAPDWIIVGGESGPQARAMNPVWATDIMNDAHALSRKFHFKQWGEFDVHGERVGKVRAGRILGGRTWDERPLAA